MDVLFLIFGSSLYAGQGDWWMDISDPRLHSVIEAGLKQSPDANIAQERVRQAAAAASQQRAGFLPSIGASWSSNTQPRDALGFGFGLGSLGSMPGMPSEEEDEEEELFTAGTAAVQLNLPLDVWGSAYAGYSAARSDKQATQSDRNNAMLTLGLNIAGAYYDVIAAQQRLDIVGQQVALSQILLESTTMRQQRSEATSLDVLQQRQQLSSIEIQVPRTALSLKIAQQRLSLLMGVSPSEKQEVPRAFSTLPSVSSVSKEGLISSRPDVQAAQHRLEAAKKRRYAAMSGLFPSLSIGGQISRQLNYSSKEEEWNSIDVYAFSTGVSVTLFQGGAKWAGFESAKAGERIAEENLRKATLVAEQEILQTLDNERSNEEILNAVRKNVRDAEMAFQEAQKRYDEGLAPLLTLITTQQNHLQAQLNYIQGQRDVFSGRLQTYRALGGVRLEKAK